MTTIVGMLGRLDVPAGADAALYTCAAGAGATLNLSMCNRTASVATVRVAITSGGAPAPADYVEYDTQLPANGILERTGLVMTAGEKLYVRADIAGISARAHGFEK